MIARTIERLISHQVSELMSEFAVVILLGPRQVGKTTLALQPWASNGSKRLVRSPKVYVRDSGLVHALLGLPSIDDLLSHPVAGGSWEGWVLENLLTAAPPTSQAFFYRSRAGAEVDLILQLPRGALWAIEIKRSSAPVVSRGFHGACDDLKVDRAMVVHGGYEAFPLPGDVQALPLARAMHELHGANAQP